MPVRLASDKPEQARKIAAATPAAGEETGPFLTVLERAASGPAFKTRLTSEPVSVLAEQGIVLPGTNRVVVVVQSDTEGYLFVPPVPEGLDIDSLEDTAGFACIGGRGSAARFAAARFAAATGLDPLAESSVGEFLLGRSPLTQ